MIKKFSHTTVVKVLLVLLATVFFSVNLFAQDSSLINLESGLNDLVYDISRSIITVEATEPIYPNNFSGNNNEAIYSVISSGLIYDTAGHVLTLASSVIDRSQIKIHFEDKIIPARLVAVDYQSGLALLKMQYPYGLPFSQMPQTGCAGQMIVAVGNSYGVRAAPALGFCSGFRPDGLMQFTASFTSSTHGGGIFTLTGKLIGIITGVIGKDSKIGLALPAHKLPEIVQYLKTNGDRLAGYLGLSTTEFEISPPIEVRVSNRLASTHQSNVIVVSRGLVVSKVIPNSPAAKAGLKQGDLIFQANGRPIDEAIELANYVKKSAPGTLIHFDILRQNNAYSVQLAIGQMKLTSSTFGNTITNKDLVTDSILKEIQTLKETLYYLENRLKRLR